MEQYFSPLPVVERSGVCRCHFRTPAKGDPLVGRMPALSLRAILGGGHPTLCIRTCFLRSTEGASPSVALSGRGAG